MNTPIKLASAIALALGVASPCVYSAALPRGAQLTITQGVATTSNSVTSSVTGSYFGMDNSGNSKIAQSEKTLLSQGTTGIVIGATTTAGASHSGLPTGVDTNAIDDPWNFFGNTGSHFNSVAITGSTTAGMVMSGWRVTWNGIPTINMGTGAWATGTGAGHTGATGTFTNGVGNLTWNGTNGGAYVLNYRATVPNGDPSGFGNVRYELHLEGVVTNDAPTISVPDLSALPSTLQTFSVTAADANPSTGVANTNLTCSIGSQGATGTATVQANCSGGTYTDTSGAPGSDSFTVVVSDGLDTATDTVNVTVTNNPAPNASDFSAEAVDTTPATIDFTPNVSNLGGDNIDWTTLTVNCASGAGITNNNDGTIDYAGVAGFSGTDACTYTVDDSASTSNSATLSVLVYGTGVGSSAGTLSGGTTTSVPADADVGTQCIGGCFDFTVSGIAAGSSVQVVLPLSRTIPADVLYRKYLTGSGWQNFEVDADNAVASAASTTILGTAVCPPPGDASYLPGLAVGDDCVQLTILDGGPNDDDATPGQIADPSGIATQAAATIGGPSGGGGCALSTRPASIGAGGDWLLVGAALAGLGVFRRRVF